jgi:epoxyqueuosine reductase
VGQRSAAALVGELRRRGEEAGLAAVGIAPATPMEETRRILEERKAAGLSATMQFTYRNPVRSTDPSRLLPGAAALVVGAWPYGGRGTVGTPSDGRPPSGRPKGIVARYASRDHYADLGAALGGLAEVLKRAGWQARVVFDDNALVDRAAAERAGIGWFGKNSNVLLPGRGSWFLLGSVVTDAPLPVSTQVDDGCGPCKRCLGSCPTGALVAPGVLDARRCLAWLLQATGVFPLEYRVALGGRIYGCDDCQDVCPANRLAARLPGPDGVDKEGSNSDEPEVDLLEMLAASGPALLARHGRWYIPERDPRYLRRNALVALGNVGDGQSPEVQATLERYLDGPDDLLRAHAIWAAISLGRRDLVAGRPALAEDASTLVREEINRS